MILPPILMQEMEARLGGPVRASALSGGDVNHAALVTRGSERLVVKWKLDAPAGAFGAEADGLTRLGETGAIRIPAVIAWDDDAGPPWLALEYVPARPPTDERAFGRRFGEALAALHQNNPSFLAALHQNNPSFNGCFGLDRDNFLGSQPQPNIWNTSWAAFYRDQRLLPQIRRARSLGLLPPERERRLTVICDRMDSLLADFAPAPVLIHGDLWSGNFLCADDAPALIDPAVYYAEREVELAYTQLFGGFPPGFHAAYDAAFPLNAGYTRRCPLHQIYPLLIHVNHFGETYGPALDDACRMALD